MKGLDVSSWQWGLDYQAVKAAGREFVIIKATGGIGYRNPYLERQTALARDAGLCVAFYHYFIEPSVGYYGNGSQEFLWFYDAVKNLVQPGDSFWLDLEEPNPPGYPYNQETELHAFGDGVYGYFGCDMGVYLGTYFWRQMGFDTARMARYPLWLPSWQDSLPAKQFLDGFPRIAIWQYDAFGQVANIKPIDENEFMLGGRDELQALGYNPAPPVQITDKAAVIEVATELDPWAELKQPYGPHAQTVHPYFHGDYSLARYGFPVGPACLYDDGRIRQAFENGCFGSNGRDEPRLEGSTFAYAVASGQELGAVVYDFSSVHPLR